MVFIASKFYEALNNQLHNIKVINVTLCIYLLSILIRTFLGEYAGGVMYSDLELGIDHRESYISVYFPNLWVKW